MSTDHFKEAQEEPIGSQPTIHRTSFRFCKAVIQTEPKCVWIFLFIRMDDFIRDYQSPLEALSPPSIDIRRMSVDLLKHSTATPFDDRVVLELYFESYAVSPPPHLDLELHAASEETGWFHSCRVNVHGGALGSLDTDDIVEPQRTALDGVTFYAKL